MSKLGQFGRVLVVGDDMRIFLTICRAFGRAGKEVHAAPSDPESPALKSRYIHSIHRLPPPEASSGAWYNAMSRLVAETRFDLVVPCEDAAILAFDRYRDRFPDCVIAIPAVAAMDRFFDKDTTHRMCERLAIPVLSAAVMTASDTPEKLIAEFGLPLVIKPRRSIWADRPGQRDKVEIIENQSQLHVVLPRLTDRSRFLIEQFFDGAGVGVSVLAKDGNILQAFQHRRLREGKGGCSSYRVSEAVDPLLREACAKICMDTAHTGVCMFEFRTDYRSGKWVLLETNARFWGSMPLPVALGVDFPNLLYDLLVLGCRHPETTYATGIRSRNFMLDGYNLLKRLRETGIGELRSWLAHAGRFMLQPASWLTGAELSDSFVRDDLRPALAECLALPANLWRKVQSAQSQQSSAKKITVRYEAD
jgi:predicted ATP-grasp superfamily ATP-dependent carboligase